jgi:hypothetical protein
MSAVAKLGSSRSQRGRGGLRKVDVELYGREEPLGGEVKEENLAGMRLLPSLMHRRWTKNGRAQQLMFS